eukprot:315646-Amphidinium_carterae.2
MSSKSSKFRGRAAALGGNACGGSAMLPPCSGVPGTRRRPTQSRREAPSARRATVSLLYVLAVTQRQTSLACWAVTMH